MAHSPALDWMAQMGAIWRTGVPAVFPGNCYVHPDKELWVAQYKYLRVITFLAACDLIRKNLIETVLFLGLTVNWVGVC